MPAQLNPMHTSDSPGSHPYLALGIYAVSIYRLDGEWFLDDSSRDLLMEPLVDGMPEIIQYLLDGGVIGLSAVFPQKTSINPVRL